MYFYSDLSSLSDLMKRFDYRSYLSGDPERGLIFFIYSILEYIFPFSLIPYHIYNANYSY